MLVSAAQQSESAIRIHITPPFQSILKEISRDCSLEGLMLKLKLQYFGHLMRRADSLEKTLMLGGIGAGGEGDDRGWDGWMASLTQWAWVWVDSWSWWWTGRPGVLQFMGLQRVGHDWATELNWTPPFWIFLTSRSPQNIQWSSWRYAVDLLQLSIPWIAVYTRQSHSYCLTHFPPFLPWCPYICSLCLCLYFSFANRFTCIIFLDSAYMH